MSERTKEQVIVELVEAAKAFEKVYWSGVNWSAVNAQTLRGSKKSPSVCIALLVRELQELERKPRFVVRDQHGWCVWDEAVGRLVSTHYGPDHREAREAAEAMVEWCAQKYGRWV